MKKIFTYVLLVTILVFIVFFAPAYWTGHAYKQQLVSQGYTDELNQHIRAFIQRSKANQAAQRDRLIENWEGEGRLFLENNLANTQYRPELFFDNSKWQMHLVGLNTFAIDADLQVQLLRVQFTRRRLVKWRLQGVCLLDTERADDACAFPENQ